MGILEQLEAAGERRAPGIRAAFLALEAEVAELRAHVRELERRLALNSTNSSRPPWSCRGVVARPKGKSID